MNKINPKSATFFRACENGNIRDIKLYLSNGEDINSPFSEPGNWNLTPLLTTLKNKKYDAFIELIKSGADVNSKRGYMSPLNYAVKYLLEMREGKGEKYIQALVEGGADLNEYNLEKPLIFRILKKGTEELINLCLNYPYDPNLTDGNGNNLLIYTKKYCYYTSPIEKILKNKNLNINHQDGTGQTILHRFSTFISDHFVITLFKERNDVDVNITDNEGRTAAFYLSKYEFYERLVFLVEKGLDWNIKNKKGLTFLDGRNNDSEKEKVEEYIESISGRNIKRAGVSPESSPC